MSALEDFVAWVDDALDAAGRPGWLVQEWRRICAQLVRNCDFSLAVVTCEKTKRAEGAAEPSHQALLQLWRDVVAIKDERLKDQGAEVPAIPIARSMKIIGSRAGESVLYKIGTGEFRRVVATLSYTDGAGVPHEDFEMTQGVLDAVAAGRPVLTNIRDEEVTGLVAFFAWINIMIEKHGTPIFFDFVDTFSRNDAIGRAVCYCICEVGAKPPTKEQLEKLWRVALEVAAESYPGKK